MIPIPKPQKEGGSFALLRGQSGITLIETLVLMLVIVVLLVSIYIGIIYAERQLLANYRNRAATLLVVGELEMEYYRHSRSKPFELQLSREFVLDDRDPENIVFGSMTVERKTGLESSNEQLLNFQYLEATLSWKDPVTEETRFIRMREDYFL
ncbi:MAG: hypothetical protein R6T89_04860 [Candidatus Syntrophosphaera sp.]